MRPATAKVRCCGIRDRNPKPNKSDKYVIEQLLVLVLLCGLLFLRFIMCVRKIYPTHNFGLTCWHDSTVCLCCPCYLSVFSFVFSFPFSPFVFFLCESLETVTDEWKGFGNKNMLKCPVGRHFEGVLVFR